MNIKIFVVNFNSDEYALSCARSIITAANKVVDLQLQVVICDNSEKSEEDFNYLAANLAAIDSRVNAVRIEKNRGYFGCMPLARKLSGEEQDCVIYCNPDILFDASFFMVLQGSYANSNAILAPCIIAGDGEFDQNPIYLNRLSRLRIGILRFVYRHSVFLLAYAVIAYFRNKSRADWRSEPSERAEAGIYAAHGSIFVFTNMDFFRNLPEFPCFLFLEEIFVAEEARKAGVSTIHAKDLVVRHERHVSIAALSAGTRRKHLAKSMDFIIEQYYQ